METASASLLVWLLAVIVFQQVYFMRQIQKLVDKVMSRDFSEYQRAVQPKPERAKLAEYPPMPEDLSVLHRI